MKSRSLLTITIVLTITLFASSAFAWRSIRTGQKNFQRAWNAYLSKQPDKAGGYFAKAADAFGQALAEVPPSRTTMFPSNLTMGGMSLYYSGRYEAAVKAMAKAADKEEDIWEAYLYAALSQAHLGNGSEMEAGLKAYLDTSPGQPILSNAVKKQLAALEKDPNSAEAGIALIENALQDQFINNYTFSRKSSANGKNACSGQFWWRYFKAPCERNNVNVRD